MDSKKRRQASDAVNNNDREPRGNFKTDNSGYSSANYRDLTDRSWNQGNPNAVGPTMRPLYDETAAAPTHWADQHDANPEDVPYPRIQRGAVAQGSSAARFRSKTGDDERAGPGGPWGSPFNPSGSDERQAREVKGDGSHDG